MNRGRVYLDDTPKAPFELFQAGVNDNSANFNSSIKSILHFGCTNTIFAGYMFTMLSHKNVRLDYSGIHF